MCNWIRIEILDATGEPYSSVKVLGVARIETKIDYTYMTYPEIVRYHVEQIEKSIYNKDA